MSRIRSKVSLGATCAAMACAALALMAGPVAPMAAGNGDKAIPDNAAASEASPKPIRGRTVTCTHLAPRVTTAQSGRCYVYEGEKRIELNRWIVREGWA